MGVGAAGWQQLAAGDGRGGGAHRQAVALAVVAVAALADAGQAVHAAGALAPVGVARHAALGAALRAHGGWRGRRAGVSEVGRLGARPMHRGEVVASSAQAGCCQAGCWRAAIGGRLGTAAGRGRQHHDCSTCSHCRLTQPAPPQAHPAAHPPHARTHQLALLLRRQPVAGPPLAADALGALAQLVALLAVLALAPAARAADEVEAVVALGAAGARGVARQAPNVIHAVALRGQGQGQGEGRRAQGCVVIVVGGVGWGCRKLGWQLGPIARAVAEQG